jgi:hypothetical protein
MFFSRTSFRKHWIRAVAFPWLVAIACAEAPEESGLPLVQNYTMRDYRAHNQVWRCVQDTRGVLYFGNRGVILEFDGEIWRQIEVPRGLFVRGLAVDSAGHQRAARTICGGRIEPRA